jgi:hypothetical protein
MNKVNAFFLKLYASPVLIWKLSASIIFLVFGAAIFLVPAISQGLGNGTKTGFGLLLLGYGVFRFFTFYLDYKKPQDE